MGAVMYRARPVADRAFIALRRPPIRARRDGLELRGFLRHRSFLQRLETADYEDYSIELFLGRILASTVTVDGGAHLGYVSLAASRKRPARLIAVEPDPYNFAALTINARSAGVELIRAALSEQDGDAVFYSSSGTVAGSLVNKSYVHDKTAFDVPLRSVDSLLAAGAPQDILIKLDVEGAEAPVLRGGRSVLEGCRRGGLLVEHNPSALADAGSSAAEILELLEGYGFRSHFVCEEERELEPVSAAQPPTEKGNIWSVKD